MTSRRVLDSKAWDQIVGVVGIVCGVLVLVLGRRHAFGAWTNPGPGMMPVLTGVFIAGLSATLWATSFRRSRHTDIVGASPWSAARWRPVISTLAALLAYAALLDSLGFVVATFLLLIVLLRALEPPTWTTTVLSAALVTGASYGIFVKLLQVQLPRASWGF